MGLSDEVLESVNAGREAAVEAVHKFANILEEATSQEGDPSRRKTLIEAARQLGRRTLRGADGVVAQHHAQYD